MTTFTVPAAVEADESPVYVAVAGEESYEDLPDLSVPPPLDPPSALVTLLDPCEWCDKGIETREGCVCGNCTRRHPDCHGSGFKLVTLQREVVRWATHQHSTERPGSSGIGGVHLTEAEAMAHPNAIEAVRLNGIVSLPGLYRLTALLLVVTDHYETPDDNARYVVEHSQGTTLRLEWGEYKDITVHGDPEPGGYIAMFEKVDD